MAQVQLPLAEVETDAGGYDEESHEVGGIGAAAGKVQVSGCHDAHGDGGVAQTDEAVTEPRRLQACAPASASIGVPDCHLQSCCSTLPRKLRESAVTASVSAVHA